MGFKIDFWKAYFAVVEVLKTRLQIAEDLLESDVLSPSSAVELKPKKTSPKKILVLEPLEKNRILMVHYLKAYPFKIEFVKTLEEAKKYSSDFDLFIDTTELARSEASMNGMPGLKVSFPIEKSDFLSSVQSAFNE